MKTTRRPLTRIYGILLPSLFAISSASAATNLILNGSFETAGATGVNSFTDWAKLNSPVVEPATVIGYNSAASYPDGAYSESVVRRQLKLVGDDN